MKSRNTITACLSLFVLTAGLAAMAAEPPRPAYSDLLKESTASDWRPLDEENTLYLELASGRVVIEMSPAFAPNHVANIKALVREGYFDGLAIIRSQDNYVAQWGDATDKKAIKSAKKTLPAEFTVPVGKGTPFTRLPDVDGYAKQVGFADGFYAGRDGGEGGDGGKGDGGRTWLTHCYGALGVARGNDADSGGGTSLYVVNGHAPRHLDRNLTVVGRVVEGMPLLSSLPRGTGRLGFYEKPEQNIPIRAIRVAADVPRAERTSLEVIRTDTALFARMVESLRNRGGDFFKVPAGHIELCNMPIAVRSVTLK